MRASFDGSLRLRTGLLNNLDLDRGLTTSGDLLFPVSLSEPGRQSLFDADMRLRADLGLFAPGGMVGVKLRVDVLDNIPFGGSADGIPGGTATQEPPPASFILRRAYGEVVTPLGYFAAGRMGHHWGLGMLGNSGDCTDCDSGDAADRLAFATTAVGHIFAFAYDFSATGHLIERDDGIRAVEIEPSAAVRSLAVAILNWRGDSALRRRRIAGKTSFEYGAYYAYRWQDTDIPSSYLPVAHPVDFDGGQVVQRDLRAHAVDAWMRLTHPYFRLEIEAAYLMATVGQASMLPGFETFDPVESDQFGFAFESSFGRWDGVFEAGINAGFASGDPAPGFGARPALDELEPPQPGDLDGPQALPPYDNRVDNFRFHSDYRVDRILFREIIGTVTDAIYVRPHCRVRLVDFGSARLEASVAAIASWAHHAISAPGMERPLGIEIDPTLRYHNDNGFTAQLDYAALIPLAGLDNPSLGMAAQPAQLLRLNLAYGW